MSTYKPVAAESKEIRKAYKALGWSSKMISVRSESYSMGSSINVIVKHPAVDLEQARAIAEGKEDIDRCKITGEILNGGNRYVHFNTDDEAIGNYFLEQYREVAERLLGRLDGMENGESINLDIFPCAEGQAYIKRDDQYRYRLDIWPEGATMHSNTSGYAFAPRNYNEADYDVRALLHAAWRVGLIKVGVETKTGSTTQPTTTTPTLTDDQYHELQAQEAQADDLREQIRKCYVDGYDWTAEALERQLAEIEDDIAVGF